MDPLDKHLKQIGTNISKGNSRTSSTTSSDECPICGGMGYVTKNVPVGHPDFGKAFPCVCQHEEIAARKQARLFKTSNLSAFQDKTFDTFVLDLPGLNDEQSLALRAAFDRSVTYAADPQGWMFFQGGFGTGKTHLAAAIANEQLASGRNVIFVTVPDLLDHLRSAFGPSSEVDYDELFEQVRTTPLLVLDDLGAESPTPWAQEKLYQIINHRYMHRLATVITTNSDIGALDPRVQSRLVDRNLTNSISLQLPDFRRGEHVGAQTNTLSRLGLYGSKTFETFDLRQHSLPPNEYGNLHKVYELAIDFAKHPQGWLLLMGGHGSGKTHLAAAIANYRQSVGEKVIFISVPDLLDYLRAAFSPDSNVSFDQRFIEIQSVPLLVLDQIDASGATSWAREKLRQIAEYRYLAGLPTVFTTAQTLEELDPVLKSRLLDRRTCQNLSILAPDYAGGGAKVPHTRSKRPSS